MNRKTRRLLLGWLSRIPGAYSALSFVLARRVTVHGWSMAPTLLPEEKLLFDRLVYARQRPQPGDVVLVAHPLGRELRMVKRLAGVPGDVVDDGHVLARGEYWVEGDNPDASTDSREFGPVRRADLLGRAWVLYWPVERWRVVGGDW